jgi:hypothetical protein
MKRILLIVTVICISFSLCAQRMNNRGEYMVKTAIWKVYGGYSSFRIDLEYNSSNQLHKITKKYVMGNNKITEIYTLRNDNGKYLKFIRYVNGKQNFSAICKYNFNEDNLISYINWYAPSQNKLVQAFQLFYNENRELVKLTQTTSENMDKDWSSKTVTTINWENGNIISDKVIRNDDNEFPGKANFVYYPESEVINNTNLNLNFLIFYCYGRDYTMDVVFGTEWCGKNTNLILKGDEDSLKRYKHLQPEFREHYEYEKNGDLITKLRYIAPRVGEKHNYVYGTLTLEYVY